MTVTATNRKNNFITNGVTVDFTFTFAITNIQQVNAITILNGVETPYTNFSVVQSPSTEGGTLTTNDVLDGVELLIYRDTSLTQQVDYQDGGRFPADSHEQALDKLTLQNQDQQDDLNRSLKTKIGDDSNYEVGNLESGKLVQVVGNELTTDGSQDTTGYTDIQAIARSLNISFSAVIYSTDTTTVLDNVQYIYDMSNETTWSKPSGVQAGDVIISVVDDQLEVTSGTYTMIAAIPALIDNADLHDTLAGAKSRVDAVSIPLNPMSVRIIDRANAIIEYTTGETVDNKSVFQHDTLPLQLKFISTSVKHVACFGDDSLQQTHDDYNEYVNRPENKSVAVYQYVEADTVGALGGKFNIKPQNNYAQIANDVHTCWIGYGGHEDFTNVIGTIPGSGASYSGVLGYDNKTDALATVMWHFHGKINTAADHPTMIGGSFAQILGGSYTVILGGTQNTINGGNYTAILGGRDNTINAASGATIVGGNGNINGSPHSVIGGGLANLIGTSGDQTVIAGGGQNTATQEGTTISGGRGNTVSAAYANITGGQDNEASGSYSRAGGRESVTQYGCDVWASGGFSGVAGSAQLFNFVTRVITTDGVEANQYLDGSAVKLEIPENSAWAIKTQCIASDGTDRAVFEFNSLIYRGAGSTALSPTQSDPVTVIHQTAGASTWSHRITVPSSGAINIKATGEAGKNIKWVTRCTATQLLD